MTTLLKSGEAERTKTERTKVSTLVTVGGEPAKHLNSENKQSTDVPCPLRFSCAASATQSAIPKILKAKSNEPINHDGFIVPISTINLRR